MTDFEKEKIIELVKNCIPEVRLNKEDTLEKIYSELQYSGDYELDSGLYKMAIISKNMDFVVKIPFNKTEDCGIFSPLADNCLQELEMYKKMDLYGFSCFFAKSEFLAEVNNIPIYIQEKVKTYYNFNYNKLKDKKYKTNQYKRFLRWISHCNTDDILDNTILHMPKVWWMLAIKFYGYEKVKCFAEFVMSGDIDIEDIWNDLHYENFGFREKDGSPCILDFSGNSYQTKI